MGQSKIGLYLLDWFHKGLVLSGGWAAVKFHLPMDDIGLLRQVRAANPNALMVGRLNPGKTHAMGWGFDLCGVPAHVLWPTLWSWAKPLKDAGVLDAVMAKNECNNRVDYALTDAYLAQQCAKVGLIYVGSSWSYGNTPVAQEPGADWLWYRPALWAGSWLNEHAYFGPGQDPNWYAHRHRQWWPRLPIRRPVFFGEMAALREDVGGGMDVSLSEQVESMIRFDRELPDYVAAATVFCVGTDGNPRWDRFDVGRDERGERLAEYVRANPAAPWRERLAPYLSDASEPVVVPGGNMAKIKLGHIYTGDFFTTQRFGANPDRYAQFGFAGHEGVDIACPLATPCLAPFDGRIIVVKDSGSLGYGRHIYLFNAAQLAQVVYAHLSEIKVAVGQQVRRRQLIGLTGNTGNSTGPHLHFGLRRTNAKGIAVGQGNGYKGFLDPLGSEVQWDLVGPDTALADGLDPDTEAELRAENATLRQRVRAVEAEKTALVTKITGLREWYGQAPWG